MYQIPSWFVPALGAKKAKVPRSCGNRYQKYEFKHKAPKGKKWKFSLETRIKMSEYRKANFKPSDKNRAATSAALKKYHQEHPELRNVPNEARKNPEIAAKRAKTFSETMKKKWSDPEYRRTHEIYVRKALEKLNNNPMAKQKALDKAAASKGIITADFYIKFILSHCPEVPIEPDMPMGYYKEMLEFFHPEMVFMLEREWQKATA